MAGFVKVLNTGDVATELTGTAYRTLIIDSTGALVEVAHGTANKVWTSGGASADPTWEDAAAGAHALDAGQTDVTITTPADDEVLSYETGTWINKTASEAGLSEVGHLLGSADHGADTLANLNAKISDATVVDTGDSRFSDTRTPTASSVGNTEIDNTATDIAVAQLIFTPASDGTGTTEGTVYFDTEDKHLYVYVS